LRSRSESFASSLLLRSASFGPEGASARRRAQVTSNI